MSFRVLRLGGFLSVLEGLGEVVLLALFAADGVVVLAVAGTVFVSARWFVGGGKTNVAGAAGVVDGVAVRVLVIGPFGGGGWGGSRVDLDFVDGGMKLRRLSRTNGVVPESADLSLEVSVGDVVDGLITPDGDERSVVGRERAHDTCDDDTHVHAPDENIVIIDESSGGIVVVGGMKESSEVMAILLEVFEGAVGR